MPSDPTVNEYVPRHDGADYETDVPYPPYVQSLEEKRRWDVCEELAEAMFGDLDPGQARAQIWSATRVYYRSDMPTGDESERCG
jgi:hypothetical protein